MRFALSAERGCLLLPGCIAAAVAAGAKDYGNALVLIEDGARQVSGRLGFIIRMSHDDENVGFEAIVGRNRLDDLRERC